MKKIGFVLAMILTLVMLCGCERYVNNYSATILITSCQGDEANIEFDTFKGTYHFKLRRDGDADHTLDFESSLAEGEMNIYIGVDGKKELLRTVKGGETYDETITLDGKYDNEKTIYITLESIGKCVDGDFEFEYN
ncbi:MAG: hypothetical protein E7603_01825 [Ruminococcaceae bacterium]|nr:hypothetical protein [Oscillospiraceae bacterium]